MSEDTFNFVLALVVLAIMVGAWVWSFLAQRKWLGEFDDDWFNDDDPCEDFDV